MLSREGIEASFLTNPGMPAGLGFGNAFQYSLFRELKDHHRQPFLPGPPHELRLIFSLSVDSFNPFQMKTAKQSASSTGIWLVLMNLPLHLQHLRRNMHLAGIIPGPDKPSLEEINPYVQLIVDEFLEFWHPGVFFSRTHDYFNGRLAQAMLIPLVCDMLAARQVIGSHSSPRAHDFCTGCNLDQDDIDCTDLEKWLKKELSDIRAHAIRWKNSGTRDMRNTMYSTRGWRWSPLFDLPYWDPIKCTMVDPMHAFELNSIQNQFRCLFRIDINHPGGARSEDDASSAPPRSKRASANEAYQIPQAIRVIRENADRDSFLDKILIFSRKVLYSICEDLNIRHEGEILGTRWVLANRIYAWVRSLMLLL